MKVRLYVEGGGDSSELIRRRTAAFTKLLEKAGFKGRMPSIRPCGSRRSAYEDFSTAQKTRGENDYPILLVDSETVVTLAPWEHLKARREDNWDRPDGAEDEQAQLMVTCMETWIVADRAALKKVFKQGFNEGVLPPQEDLEQRTKEEVQQKLEDATHACGRDRKYEKGKRSFQLAEELNPDTLEPLLPHFSRLKETLNRKL